MNGERYQQTWSQIGRYDLIGEIGRGGMGVVYRAYEAALDRTVALKLLAPDLADQPGVAARLRREAISAARLRHPNIALLYEFGQSDETPFLAMEYVPGSSLRQLLAAGPLPIERTIEIVDQIGAALDYAHRMGIVHRDVKPSNILVGPGDHAVLIDFGLADIAGSTLLTADSAVLGTPHYMAPEQAAGRGADARSDQYALAAVTYEMLTGVPPFHGRAATAVVHAHIYDLPPPPTEQRPTLPAAVNRVLLRALAKSPYDRYLSLEEFAAALRAALAPPPAARSRWPSARWRLLLGAAGGLALALVALLAALLPRGSGGEGALRVSAHTTPRGDIPLPRQVIWTYAPEPKLIGGPAPVAADGTLVLGTLDGDIMALQAASGEVRWRQGNGKSSYGAPSVGASLVFVGNSDEEVLGLSLSSGEPNWRRRVTGLALQPPTLDGDRLVVTTDKGYIYMLQAGSGLVIWNRPLATGALAPAAGAERVFVSAGRKLFSLDASNGAVEWEYPADDTITTRPVIFEDLVVVGTERGLLLAVRIADGELHLRYQAGGPLSVAPAVGANAIYLADQSGALTAISPVSASVLWRYEAGMPITTSPLLLADNLYFGTANGLFYALGARDGRQIARLQLGGSVLSAPAIDHGLIFVRADKIYALGS